MLSSDQNPSPAKADADLKKPMPEADQSKKLRLYLAGMFALTYLTWTTVHC